MSKLISSELQTDRLIMGCYRECDFYYIKEALGDKELCKNIGAKPILDDRRIKEYIQDNIKTFTSDKYLNTRVALFIKENKRFIGNIGIYKKDDYIELGWWLLSEYRHQGYMKEALKYILEFFNKNKYTIIANIFDFNTDSKMLANKVGMKPNKFYESYIEYKY